MSWRAHVLSISAMGAFALGGSPPVLTAQHCIPVVRGDRNTAMADLLRAGLPWHPDSGAHVFATLPLDALGHVAVLLATVPNQVGEFAAVAGSDSVCGLVGTLSHYALDPNYARDTVPWNAAIASAAPGFSIAIPADARRVGLAALAYFIFRMPIDSNVVTASARWDGHGWNVSGAMNLGGRRLFFLRILPDGRIRTIFCQDPGDPPDSN